MYLAVPTDQSHPHYQSYRKGLEILSYTAAGYGLIRGGIKAVRWGSNLFKARRGALSLIERLTTSRGPSKKILFGQSTVSPQFRHGDFKGKSIYEMVNELKNWKISANQFPIDYVVRNGQMITINNRSLLTLKRAKLDPTILRNRTGDPFYEELLSNHLQGLAPSENIRIRGGPPNTSWIGP